MLRWQHTVITVAIRTSGRNHQTALEQRPPVDAVHITGDMLLALLTARREPDVLLMTITADFQDIERVDRRFAIRLWKDIVPAVTGRTARGVRVAFGCRFGMGSLQKVRLGLGVTTGAATCRSQLPLVG